MISSNVISKLSLDGESFKIAVPELEHRVDRLEATISDSQEVYTTQYGWQTTAEAMRKVAQAAEEAMHGVYEAMARIYCLEDRLNASSASAESENPDENPLGDFLDEITKDNIFLQNLK